MKGDLTTDVPECSKFPCCAIIQMAKRGLRKHFFSLITYQSTSHVYTIISIRTRLSRERRSSALCSSLTNLDLLR